MDKFLPQNFMTIKAKLATLITLLLAVISFFIYSYFPKQFENQAMKAVSAKAESIATMLAFSISPAMYFEDIENIEKILKCAQQNKDLAFIIVYNDSGRNVASVNEKERAPTNLKQKSKNRIIYQANATILHNNIAIGSLCLGISLKEIKNEVAKSKKTIAGISFLIFVIGMMAVIGISVKVTAPLQRVVETAEQISKGNLSKRAYVTSHDEVGHLARSFNRMVEKLEAAQIELKYLNQNLEKRVQQRTTKLWQEIKERKRAEKVLASHLTVTETLCNSVEKLNRSVTLTEVYKNAIACGLISLKADKTSISVFDTDGNSHLQAWHGFLDDDRAVFDGYFLGPGDNVNAQAVFWENIEQSDFAEEVRTFFLKRNIHACALFPITGEKYLFGHFLTYYSKPHKFASHEIQVGKVLAENLSTAVKRITYQQKLASEKEQLAVTLRSIGDGVITTDINGQIILLNKAAEKLTGWSYEQAIGKPLHDVLRINSTRNRKISATPGIDLRHSDEMSFQENHEILIAKDGSELDISEIVAPIRDRDSNVIGVVIAFRDITEKLKMEKEQLKATKLELIERLADGIAHDFNNFLTAILTNISLAKLDAKPGDELYEILSDIEKASLQAKELTQQLQTFARDGAPVKRTASLVELIKDSANFALRGSNVRCEYFLPETLWSVDIDEGQINQVIQNLVINAYQAMPAGGVINITADNIIISSNQFLPLSEGKYVKVLVQDEGVGIPPENLTKIFDPYFTTKPGGTGLGLATSYSIIKKHDGLLTVDSIPGAGTTFYIYLPASENQKRPKQITPEKKFTGRGKILILDDEEIIRKTVGKMLERIGYEAVLTGDGAEAISLFDSAYNSNNPFHAVLLDLTIPGGMGGLEVMKRLAEIDPEIKAILCSGYSIDTVMMNYGHYGFKAMIIKPFKIEELDKVLHNVTGYDQRRK